VDTNTARSHFMRIRNCAIYKNINSLSFLNNTNSQKKKNRQELIHMRKVILNYARYSATHPSRKMRPHCIMNLPAGPCLCRL
jgi:hypothetical protein